DLVLTDQPDGAALCREVYGDRLALVPYRMPGFDLAKAVAGIYAEQPDCEGIVLLQHGIFTFGPTAREAYERMVEFVTLAERRVAAAGRKIFPSIALPAAIAAPAAVAPILRGLLARPVDPAEGIFRRFVLTFRTGEAIRNFVDGAEVGRYSQQGTITPDHSIRTKAWPAVLPAPDARDLAGFAEAAARAIADYEARYDAYFRRHNPRFGGGKTPLDPAPRVLLVPGLGIFAAGESAKAAAIAGDLAEASVAVITDAEASGRFASRSEADAFDVEYWSLEQAKLGKAEEKPLARHIAVVTGAAGAIGRAIAAAFRAHGAEVALLDLDRERTVEAARAVGGLGIACDVTDPAAVRAAFDRVVEAFGGVDIAVSNAGAAWEGRIGEVDEAVLRRSFELNFFAHQHVAQAAVAVMRAQKTGGVLLFNASKQAVNPGPNFGPYGLPKAATLALMRQYAVDYGAEGIAANAV